MKVRNRISVLSVPVDVITQEETVNRVQSLMQEPGLHIVVTANAEMIMHAQKDKELFTILQEADLVIPDGAGVLWAAERQGKHFPERCPGIDVAVSLFKRAAQDQTPIYCIGAAPGVVDKAMANMQEQVGKLNLVGTHDGFFNEQEERLLVEDIKTTGAKLVFVALGVPKQEKWITTQLAKLDGVVAMGVGGSFDVLAGNIERAPKWMQENRLEWLYRLILEPKRILRMMALPKFMCAVLRNSK